MGLKDYWKKVRNNPKSRRLFDELPVIISALGYAFVIGCITYFSDGLMVALRSLLWQLPYTYVASKIVFSLAKYFGMKMESNFWAYFLAVVVPTLISAAGTFIVQAYVVGVTNPWPTLIPTLCTTPFATFGWAKVQRMLRGAPTSK